MSDYVKITDYAAKDALLTGDPAKLVKGTEIGADFDAVAVAVATKSTGPASATDNALVRFDGATGKSVQNSAVTVDDTTGTMTFTGAAARIKADFGNNIATRTLFQTTVTNGPTRIECMPNGSATTARVEGHNTSLLGNSHAVGGFYISSAEMAIYSSIEGAAAYLPMTFYVNGSEAMRLENNGCLEMPYGESGRGVLWRNGTDYESQGTVTNPVNRSFIHDYRPLGVAQGGSAPFSADGANTFVGHSAGNFTMAPNNTAVGDYNIHCSYNAGFGTQALGLLTTGYNNAACGVNALRYNTQGYSNAAVGRDCMELNTTGSYNVAIGQSALRSNLTGESNVAIGGKSAYDLSSGSYNTFIGYSDSGTGVTTGSYNVIIGKVSGLSSSLANNLRIGDGQGNLWLSGDSSGNVTSPRGAIGYSTGAGGTVAQGSGSGKATGVTLNKPCGTITMDAATLNANTTVAFLLTNSFIGDDDMLLVSLDFNSTLYNAWCYRTNSGSANIALRNISVGDLSEAVVIKFAVIKGATS